MSYQIFLLSLLSILCFLAYVLVNFVKVVEILHCIATQYPHVACSTAAASKPAATSEPAAPKQYIPACCACITACIDKGKRFIVDDNIMSDRTADLNQKLMDESNRVAELQAADASSVENFSKKLAEASARLEGWTKLIRLELAHPWTAANKGYIEMWEEKAYNSIIAATKPEKVTCKYPYLHSILYGLKPKDRKSKPIIS